MSKKVLSIEQATELLSKLGVEVAVVAEVEEGADVANIDELADELKPSEVSGGKTDEDIKAATSSAIAKQMGSLRSLIAQTFSVKRADFEGLDQSEILPKLKALVESRYTQTENELRTQLEDSTRNYNELEERLNNEWQSRLDKEAEKFEERDIRDRFVNLLSKIPRSGGDLNKQAELMLREARSNYIVKYNPVSNQVEFYDKNNPELKVMEGKNPINDELFGNKFVDTLGIRVTDTRHIAPSSVDQNLPTGIKTIEGSEEKSALEKLEEKINAQLEGA